MTAAVYVPRSGSAGARAMEYLRKFCPNDEATSAELATAMGVDVNALSAFLASALRHKLVTRDQRDRKACWSLGPGADGLPPAAAPPAAANPDPDDADLELDDAPIARVLTSASSQSIEGIPRQSWCPAAQEGGDASSLDEPDPPPRPSPAPPPIGLGWRAPRTPVYLVDTPPPAASPESGPAADSVLGALEQRHAHAVRQVTAPSINDETVLALSAAMTPAEARAECGLPAAEDPDFREVERAPRPPEPDNPPKGAEAAQAPVTPCGRDDATPNDGVVPQGAGRPAAPPTLPLHVGAEFRCALWSNGLLELSFTDGTSKRLTRDETRELVHYLDRMVEASV